MCDKTMDLRCNFCNEYFSEINGIFSHLRKVHKVIENDNRINCLVNFNDKTSCTKSYLTFAGLRTHMKSCIISKHQQDQMVR